METALGLPCQIRFNCVEVSLIGYCVILGMRQTDLFIKHVTTAKFLYLCHKHFTQV